MPLCEFPCNSYNHVTARNAVAIKLAPQYYNNLVFGFVFFVFLIMRISALQQTSECFCLTTGYIANSVLTKAGRFDILLPQQVICTFKPKTAKQLVFTLNFMLWNLSPPVLECTQLYIKRGHLLLTGNILWVQRL